MHGYRYFISLLDPTLNFIVVVYYIIIIIIITIIIIIIECLSTIDLHTSELHKPTTCTIYNKELHALLS